MATQEQQSPVELTTLSSPLPPQDRPLTPSSSENSLTSATTQPDQEQVAASSIIPREPAGGQPTHGSAPQSVQKLKRKLLTDLTARLFRVLVALAGVIVTVYYGWQSLAYARWQAAHDFREGCESDQVRRRALLSSANLMLTASAKQSYTYAVMYRCIKCTYASFTYQSKAERRP